LEFIKCYTIHQNLKVTENIWDAPDPSVTLQQLTQPCFSQGNNHGVCCFLYFISSETTTHSSRPTDPLHFLHPPLSQTRSSC